MEQIANNITNFFIRDGVATEDTRDIYVYGLIIAFSHGIALAFTLLFGIVLQVPLLKLLAFFIPFTMTRTSVGGYHAGKFWVCAVISVLTMLGAIVCIQYFSGSINGIISVSISIVGTIGISAFAPVENANRPLTAVEVVKFRNRSRLIGISCVVIVLVFAFLSKSEYAFCVALGLVIPAVSAVVAVIQQYFGGSTNEKT